MRDLCNKARGEVMLRIDGQPHRLCVTLGALAELEAAFDVVSLEALGERLAQLSPADLVTVVSALVTGGGEPLNPSHIAAAEIDPREAARAVAEAFRLAFDDA